MSAELELRVESGEIAETAIMGPLPLSNLSNLATHVERLLAELPAADAADELTEARAKAEAASLWAQRTKHADEERHYGKMRLLAEAGLGVLSLNGYEVGETLHHVRLWRVLAAAFERGRLLECAGESTGLRDVADEVRRRGLTFVPGSALRPAPGIVHSTLAHRRHSSWRWHEARLLCRHHGIDPKSLPPDVGRIKAENEARSSAATKTAADARRYRDQIRRRRIARAATGSPVEETYGFIRQALDALGRVPSGDLPAHRKTALNDAFTHLYRAEDAIARALNLGS